MPRLQSGVTPAFSNGQTLNASDLNNHVTGASPLPDFIGLQDSLTTPASDDELLINDISGAAVKKVTLANLAGNLPATTASELTVSTNAQVTGNLTVNGNTTIGNADTDTATFNAATTFGGNITSNGTATLNGATAVNNNTTLGQAVVTGTYSRATTTLTVTKTAHGLTTGNTRWFNVENNTALSGSYSVTVLGVDTFTITVTDSGATSGNVSWYERTTTIQSTLAGTLQGDIAVQTKTVEQGSGDEFLSKDSSDSNKLRSVSGSVIKAWANISFGTPTTITGSVSRTAGSTTATVTSSSHGLRVGDVLYLVGGVASDWYAVQTVPNANSFTVTTVATTVLSSVSISWYQYAITAGNNIFCAFGRSDMKAVHVGFTNKPASAASYIVTGNVLLNGTLSTSALQFNTFNSYMDSTLLKTANGFGFFAMSGGLSTHLTTGEASIQVIW
jgi:hypothetical protein